MAAGETTVGGIVGFLRLDDDQFNRAIDEAIARVKALDGMDADVHVRATGADSVARSMRSAAGGVDSVTAASRRLEDATGRVRVAQLRLNEARNSGNSRPSTVAAAEHALTRALRDENDAIWDTYAGNIRLGESNDRLGQSARRATRDVGGLNRSFRGFHDPRVILGAIAAGMAVIGPVAGATAGAVAGLTAVVGTGVLAWKGYQREIQNGTALGLALQQQLGGLTSDLHDLEATAASAVGPGLLNGLSKLDAYLPTLDGHVSTLGKSLGNALDVSADGVISGLKTMMPLLEDGGRWAEVLAHKFADFTQSQDFRDFIAYARRELPEVAQAVGDLTKGLVDMAVALEPAGDSIVKTLGLIGDTMSLAGKASSEIPGLPDLGDVYKWTSGIGLLGKAYDLLHGKTQTAEQATAEYTDATQTSLAALDAQSTAQSGAAAALGTTFGALQAAEAAQRKNAAAIAQATANMQAENDAAGILKQTLDLLNGESLSAAEAQNAFDSSLVNMGTHVDKTGKKIHFTTTSINNMSAASVALRGQLNGQIANLQRVVEANGGLSDSTGKARKQMQDMRQQIIDNAVAHGVDRKAVTAYVDSILKIPKKVPPTKLDVDKTAADTKLTALERHLTTVTRPRTAVVNVEENYRITTTGRSPFGPGASSSGIGVRTQPGHGVRAGHGFTGTTVGGHGGPTADDQLYWLSTGEEVINAKAAKKWRPFLKAINATGLATGGTAGAATGSSTNAQIIAVLGKDLGQQVVQAFADGMNGGKDAVKSVAESIRSLIHDNAQKAADDLKSLLQEQADYAKQVGGQFASLGDLTGDPSEGGKSFTVGLDGVMRENTASVAFTGSLQSAISQTDDFTATIRKLVKLGARTDVLQQFLDKGPESAAAAAALAAMGRSGVGEVNRLQAQLVSATGSLGSFGASTVFAPRVRAARADVADAKVLEVAVQRATASQVAELRKVTAEGRRTNAQLQRLAGEIAAALKSAGASTQRAARNKPAF